MSAIATACFEGGRGKVELIHRDARKVNNEAKDWAIKNLREHLPEFLRRNTDCGVTHKEKYRAAMFMVEDAIANPTSATHKEPIMWNDLSPTASECL